MSGRSLPEFLSPGPTATVTVLYSKFLIIVGQLVSQSVNLYVKTIHHNIFMIHLP